MKKHLWYLLPLSLLLMGLYSSCKKISGVGPIVSEVRNLDGFSEVRSEIGANIFISQSAEYSIKIEGQQNIIDNIETQLVGNKLVIKQTPRSVITAWRNVTIYVTLPTVRDLTISGSGDMKVNGDLQSNHLALKVTGSGSILLDHLSAETLNAKTTGSGDITIDDGEVVEEELHITGSGSIHLDQILAAQADVKITGSGNAFVWVSEKLTVRITGSGDVRYKGNPIVDVTATGSGSVQPF